VRPILFEILEIKVHSYYVLWTFSLCLAVAMTRKRMTDHFLVDDRHARLIVAAAFLGMLAGARGGAIIEFWRAYLEEPWRLLRFWEGGLSAVPAFLGAGAAGAALSVRLGVPVWITAESAAVPAAFAVALGRWGCFLNGCCFGRQTDVPWGVIFPGDPEALLRHPVQLYYAFGALLIAALLLGAERKRPWRGAFLWPVFMILYPLLRILADPFRAEYGGAGLQTVRIILGMVMASGLLWLIMSRPSRGSGKKCGKGDP
jgi:phosphatidylglycerol:prolipoprotein diacylglycerol transferase